MRLIARGRLIGVRRPTRTTGARRPLEGRRLAAPLLRAAPRHRGRLRPKLVAVRPVGVRHSQMGRPVLRATRVGDPRF